MLVSNCIALLYIKAQLCINTSARSDYFVVVLEGTCTTGIKFNSIIKFKSMVVQTTVKQQPQL